MPEVGRERLLDRTIHAVDTFGSMLESRVQGEKVVWGALATAVVAYAVAAGIIGVARFSADSWTYYELAKTVFTGDFYRFNTVRSHFSAEYAASFPMAYPVALAMVQRVFGLAPEVALALNIAIAAATALVVIKVSDALQLPRLFGVTLAFSLLLLPSYVDEVLSGRSSPLAVLLAGLASLAFLRGANLWSGLCLGLSVLVRFDFLAQAAMLLAAMHWLQWRGPRALAGSVIGVGIGVAPWVAYSLVHFGRWWASDNTWVALSATPAFVQDYPAQSVITAFDDPGMWVTRVLGNVGPLTEVFCIAVVRYPLIPILLAIVVARRNDVARMIRGRIPIGLMLLALSIVPYLLTGYLSYRYFTLQLLCISFVLAAIVSRLGDRSFASISIRSAVGFALLVVLGSGSYILSRYSLAAYHEADAMRAELSWVASLQRCQRLMPGVTFLFEREFPSFYFPYKYGALTGMRTSVLPTNFAVIGDAQRNEFFAEISPYVRVAQPPLPGSCPR